MRGNKINMFALLLKNAYHVSTFAKSNVGINTPLSANRQSICLSMVDCLGQPAVAGRICLRGSVNLEWFATNIRLTPDGGDVKNKQTGSAMDAYSRLIELLRLAQLCSSVCNFLPHLAQIERAYS